MVSPFRLASGGGSSPAPQPTTPVFQERVPDLILQSLDGKRKIVLDGASGWTHMPGSTGLEMPPYDIIRSSVPGVAGSMLEEVRAEERPIFIPIDACSTDYRAVTHRAMLNSIRELVDPLNGEFLVICGDRQLKVIYTDGLEGAFGQDQFGLYWRKFGLKALACQPFAEARAERPLEFSMAQSGSPFLGAAGGTSAPWGTRKIVSSAVISDNMPVWVESEVPVYPVVELVGPMDSFTGTVELEDPSRPSGSRWSVSVPSGVPAGSTLRLVTNPRARSIRLDGQLAAGRVARGSTLRPFYPGVNLMSVAAPGGTTDTKVRITWRNLYRSLW